MSALDNCLIVRLTVRVPTSASIPPIKAAAAPGLDVADALRQHVQCSTLPWGDYGERLLPVAGYPVFMAKWVALRDAFVEAVDNLIHRAYPAERARACFRQGEAFDLAKWPDPEHLRSMFSAELEIRGMSTGANFSPSLDDDTVRQIAQTIDTSNQRLLADAMRALYKQLTDMLSAYADRMTTGRFKRVTVDNMQAMSRVLPTLNIQNDPTLAAVVDVLKALVEYNAAELRKDPARRAAAKEMALNAIAKLNVYQGDTR
jgi:hypothetical protein